MSKYCQAVQSRTLKLAAAALTLLLAGAVFCEEPKPVPDAAAVTKEAVELSNQGRYGEARSRFELAAKLDPGNATVHQGLGLVCMQLHLFEEARTALEKAVSLDRKLPAAQSTLGLIYEHLAMQSGRHMDLAAEKNWREKAIAAWKAVLAVDTDKPRLETARKHLERLEARHG